MSRVTKSKTIKKIVALLFALFIALTGLSGIAFAEVEADPVTEDPAPANAAEADIVFTIVGVNEYSSWLFLPQWIPVTNAALLDGVTAVDENGDPVTVTVANVGGLDLSSPQPSGGYPPAPYVITYEAAHPVTGAIYTVTRNAYVTVGIQPAAIDPSIAPPIIIYTGSGPTSATSSGSLLPLPSTPTPPPPAPTVTTNAGEVQVSKTVTYNYDTPTAPDGTVTITLYAWANTFTYTNNAGITGTYDPLVPMASGNVIEITDDVGEFFIVNPLPAELTTDTPSTGTTKIIWNIADQASLLTGTPIEVSYTLSVVNQNGVPGPPQPPFVYDYWYSTGAASAVFVPADSDSDGYNPYYYTMEESFEYEFTMSMNWNNGNGLNNGAIVDNVLNKTITFPANVSPQGSLPYNTDGSMNIPVSTRNWNWWPQVAATQAQAAMVAGTPYSWQLEWHQGTGAKTYVFTVKDLAGPGLDVQYEANFSGAGGSGAIAGNKIIVSTEYFQRTYNTNNSDPFYWDGTTIDLPLDVIGQIRLENETPPLFDFTIAKVLAGEYVSWGLDDSTVFLAYIQDTTPGSLTYGLYLVFEETSIGSGIYNYIGLSARRIPVQFSEGTPANLTGIPTLDINSPLPYLQKQYTVTEDPAWMTPAMGASISYSLSYDLTDISAGTTDPVTGSNVNTVPPSYVFDTANYTVDDIVLTITNALGNKPTGVLSLMKLFNGFPADWGITSSKVFNVKVFDAEADNYLLFVSPADALAKFGTPPPATSGWSVGTYYCVGNDNGNPDVPSLWDYSSTDWDWEVSQGIVLQSIPITELRRVGLSNLWLSTYQIHELDSFGNILDSSSPDYEWWQTYTYFQDLSRLGPPVADEVELLPGSNYIAFVTNVFEHGEGNLSLFKTLQGYPQDWGVDNNTLFEIRVFDRIDGGYLLFDPTIQTDGTWLCVGHIDPDGTPVYDPDWLGPYGTEIDVLTLSVNAPLVMSNLWPGEDHEYVIEESGPGDFSVMFEIGGGVVIDGSDGLILTSLDNMNIWIFNTYARIPGPGPGGGGGGGGGGGNNSGTGDYRSFEGWTTSLLLSSLGLICILAWVRRQISRPKYLKNRFLVNRFYPKA